MHWLTINWEKKNWKQWKNCQTYVHRLSWNVCIWHALVDLIFHGQSTLWHAKLKPVRNLVSTSRAGSSTVPPSMVLSSPRKFGSKDHEMRFEANTGQLVVQNSQRDLIKGDTMASSQVRHWDARSEASTGSPVAWESNRIKNSQASTGHTVVKKWSLTSIWRRKKNAIFLSVTSISFKKRVNERLRVMLNRLQRDKMEGIDKHSTWGMFMTSSMHAAIFLGKDDSENLHIVRNTDREPSVQKLFDVTRKLVHEQKLEILGVPELRWRTSTLEKLSLVNGEEVIKLMKAKVYVFSDSVLCFFLNTHNRTLIGKTNWSGSRAPINTENWMESMENQWSWSGGYSKDTQRCRFSKKSKD